MTNYEPTVYDDLFPGRFLKAGPLKDNPITLTIRKVYREELPTDDDKVKVRGVIAFQPDHSSPRMAELSAMELVLNVTNGKCFKALWGEQVKNWVGHAVTLCWEETKFGRETRPCIRVLGSPELKSDMPVEIALPHKKPFTRILKATGAPKPKAATPKQYKDFLERMAKVNLDEASLVALCKERSWNAELAGWPAESLSKLAETLEKELNPEQEVK